MFDRIQAARVSCQQSVCTKTKLRLSCVWLETSATLTVNWRRHGCWRQADTRPTRPITAISSTAPRFISEVVSHPETTRLLGHWDVNDSARRLAVTVYLGLAIVFSLWPLGLKKWNHSCCMRLQTHHFRTFHQQCHVTEQQCATVQSRNVNDHTHSMHALSPWRCSAAYSAADR